MRTKPDGTKRVMLAYFSIGEAESYRYYWQDSWAKNRPEWLEPENPDWPGNYRVQYWHPEWRAILYGSPNAYLDRILDAGFDGVYIDGVDKFEQWKRRRPTAVADMVDLVGAIAAHARSLRKDFLIVPQNGDGLLGQPKFLRTIDGFAREDLLLRREGAGCAQFPAQHRRHGQAVAAAGGGGGTRPCRRIHHQSGPCRFDAARAQGVRLCRLYRAPRPQVAFAARCRMRTAGLFAMKVR